MSLYLVSCTSLNLISSFLNVWNEGYGRGGGRGRGRGGGRNHGVRGGRSSYRGGRDSGGRMHYRGGRDTGSRGKYNNCDRDGKDVIVDPDETVTNSIGLFSLFTDGW